MFLMKSESQNLCSKLIVLILNSNININIILKKTLQGINDEE